MIATVHSFETDENKALFAEALLKNPNNAFVAAKTIFPRDIATALYICQRWPTDEFVLRLQKKLLLEHGEERYLPSKSRIARQIHNVSEDVNDPEMELKALRLYCDVRGYIEKPGTVVNNSQILNKIMVVKDHGTDDDWENKAIEQQQKLIESSK